MESLLLDNIDQPSDLKNLDKEQVNKLCAEIRQFLLQNISRTGGHLGVQPRRSGADGGPAPGDDDANGQNRF